jgi:hypothetical protein
MLGGMVAAPARETVDFSVHFRHVCLSRACLGKSSSFQFMRNDLEKQDSLVFPRTVAVHCWVPREL